MKMMICEICDGRDIVKENGVYVCLGCGTKYSVEEARKLLVDIDMTETEDEAKDEDLELTSGNRPSEAANSSGIKKEPWHNIDPLQEKPKKRNLLPFILLVLVLLGFGACAYTCSERSSSSDSYSYKSSSYSYSGSGSSSSSSSSDSVYIPEDLSDSLMSKIWDAAKEDVKKNLKSPSTAKFEKYYSDDVKFIKATKEDVKTGGFNLSVFSYVDSQNSFGAEIRTYFIVYFMVDRYNSFKIVDRLFYDG